MGGLKEEIRSVIALHRPRDVDMASALALLQEEELLLTNSRSHGRDYSKHFSKANSLDQRKTGENDKLK